MSPSKNLCLCLLLALPAVPAQADNHVEAKKATYEACVLDEVANAKEGTTAEQIRETCSATVPSLSENAIAVGPREGLTATDERLVAEQSLLNRSFALTAYKPNYFLLTYNDKVNQAPFEAVLGQTRPLNKFESKFQVSIKALILREPLGLDSSLYFGYTTQSWWQVGNPDISNPFRETNYEPEVFLRNIERREFLGLKVSGWDLGFNHQSNGRSEELSRSWNRIFGRAVLDLNDLALVATAWYRIPEDKEDDDNPREYRYLGYGNVRAIWAPDDNTWSLMYRPATQGGAVEFTWSRPISDRFRIFFQYWNGYGESLIDYDRRTERFGIGFALSDFLAR